MSERLPWSKFSWDVYEADSELALCSMAAQGFWMRLLCIASKNKGYVLVAGKAPTYGVLAKLVRATPREIKAWIDELRENGVLSITGKGVMYSRRLIRAHKNSDNGKQGGPAKHRIHKANPSSLQPESETESERESPKPPEGVRDAFDLWNDLAAGTGLAKAETLTRGRIRSIGKRLEEGGGLDGWRRALAAVGASPHCRGKNDRAWKADLDFVCQTKSFTRLLEGFYGTGERVPEPAAQAAPKAVWAGPAEIRDEAVLLQGEAWTRTWLDPCRWQDVPAKAIVSRSPTTVDRINLYLRDYLRKMGVAVILEEANAA